MRILTPSQLDMLSGNLIEWSIDDPRAPELARQIAQLTQLGLVVRECHPVPGCSCGTCYEDVFDVTPAGEKELELQRLVRATLPSGAAP